MSVAMPEIEERTENETRVAPNTPWNVILHNDPINTMDYVVMTLMYVLEKDQEQCEKYTMEVHNNGSAVVFTGEQEKAQKIATELQAAMLSATVEKDN